MTTGQPVHEDGSQPKYPSLKINVLSNWIALAVNIAVGFFLTPFIVSHLGKMAYGLWTLIQSFVGYYSLLDFGVGTAVTRYVARYTGSGDRRAMNEVAGTAMAMFCVTGALAIALSLLLAEWLTRFFDVSPEHFSEFKYSVWALGLSVGLGFPASVIESVVAAHERYVALSFARVAGSVLRAGLIVLLLLRGKGLLGIAFVTLAVAAVRLAIAGILSKRFAPGVRFSLTLARLSAWWELMAYGGIVTIIMVATLVQTNVATFVVGKFVGVEQVAVFGVALVIIQYVRQFAIQASNVLSPRFAALDGACEHGRMESLLLRATSNSALLAFGLGAVLVIVGRNFIFNWVGKGYAESAAILRILLLGHVFSLAHGPGVGLLYALKRHRWYAVAMGGQAVVAFILGVFLATDYGGLGVAWGTTIALLLGSIFTTFYIPHVARVSAWRYLERVGIPMVMGVALVAGAGMLNMLNGREELSFSFLLLRAGIATLIYGVFSLAVPESMGRSLLVHRRLVSILRRSNGCARL